MAGGKGAGPAAVSRLRIASFNLENLDDGPDLEARIAVLRPQLVRLAADILCLQEVNAQLTARHRPRALAALDRLLADTPYAAYERAVSGGAGSGGPVDHHNLVLLSRLPIAARRDVRHALVPPLAYRAITAEAAEAALSLSWDRPVLYAAAVLPSGRRLHLLDLHLKAPLAVAIPGQRGPEGHWRSSRGWAEGFFLAAMKRAGQALEARLLVESLFDAEPEALIVAAGDFNAEHGETPVRILLGGGDIPGADPKRVLVALDEAIPAERRYSVLHAGRPAMLDHILVSPALAGAAQRVELLNESLYDEELDPAAGRPSAGSYHAPLVAELALEA